MGYDEGHWDATSGEQPSRSFPPADQVAEQGIDPFAEELARELMKAWAERQRSVRSGPTVNDLVFQTGGSRGPTSDGTEGPGAASPGSCPGETLAVSGTDVLSPGLNSWLSSQFAQSGDHADVMISELVGGPAFSLQRSTSAAGDHPEAIPFIAGLETAGQLGGTTGVLATGGQGSSPSIDPGRGDPGAEIVDSGRLSALDLPGALLPGPTYQNEAQAIDPWTGLFPGSGIDPVGSGFTAETLLFNPGGNGTDSFLHLDPEPRIPGVNALASAGLFGPVFGGGRSLDGQSSAALSTTPATSPGPSTFVPLGSGWNDNAGSSDGVAVADAARELARATELLQELVQEMRRSRPDFLPTPGPARGDNLY